MLLSIDEEISEFLDDLRELGIGDQAQATSNQSSHPPAECNEESVAVPESVHKLASEWVPLELCYGVPLFSDETNKSVCQKVSVQTKCTHTSSLIFNTIVHKFVN